MKKLIAVALLAGFVTVSANAQAAAPAQGEKKMEKMEKKGEMMEKKGDKMEKKGDKMEKKGEMMAKKGDKMEKKGEMKGDMKMEKIGRAHV